MQMISIKFPDDESHTRALGYLAGRFRFTSYQNGEMIVPASALAALAAEGFRFAVHGPATYAQTIPALRLRELGILK